MQRFGLLFMVALSLSIASAAFVQDGYVLAEYYQSGVCSGDVVYQLFSSFGCIADLDGESNTYYKWSYENVSMTVGVAECTYSDCTGCSTATSYTAGLCYSGWTYTWVDNIVEDRVGLFYYNDSNCENIQAVETYRDSECINEGTESYLYQCDDTGQAQLTYCDSTECGTNCVTLPYPAICSLDTTSDYYTTVKCDAGNLPANLMFAAVVMLALCFL